MKLFLVDQYSYESFLVLQFMFWTLDEENFQLSWRHKKKYVGGVSVRDAAFNYNYKLVI